MDLGKIFKNALAIFKKNYVVLIIGYLVAFILSIVTLGIMAPVVWTGYLMMILKAKRGKKITVNDVFSVNKKFLSLWGLCLWICFLAAVISATVIGIIPLIFMLTWWMYSGLIVADKNTGVFKAMKMSKDIVRKNNVWMHILLLILINIIGQLGNCVFYIGTLITMPIAMAAFVSAYDLELGKKKK